MVSEHYFLFHVAGCPFMNHFPPAGTSLKSFGPEEQACETVLLSSEYEPAGLKCSLS